MYCISSLEVGASSLFVVVIVMYFLSSLMVGVIVMYFLSSLKVVVKRLLANCRPEYEHMFRCKNSYLVFFCFFLSLTHLYLRLTIFQ